MSHRTAVEHLSDFPGYVVVCVSRMTVLGRFNAWVEIQRKRDGKRICPFEAWQQPGPYESADEANRQGMKLAAFLVAADIANPET